MSLRTLTVGGIEYSVERLNAFDQYNVAKKLSTVLLLLSSIQKKEGAEGAPSALEFSKLLLAGTANLTNEDTNFVNRVCLTAVRRKQQGGAYAAMVESRTGQLMFDDIGVRELAELVWGVVEAHRMVDFFSDLPSNSEAAKSP